MQIVIVAPDQAWVTDFQHLKAKLQHVLPNGSYMHHIGSTAVPGLAAKDIIDVQVTVKDLLQVDEPRLVASGYRKGQHTSDHCPAGMTLPSAELRKLLFIAEKPRRAHIHIREAGRFNQQYPLLCRDYLRAHAVTAKSYELIKQGLAGHFAQDQAAYYDIKDPVFDLIHDGAVEWASRTGWTESAPD